MCVSNCVCLLCLCFVASCVRTGVLAALSSFGGCGYLFLCHHGKRNAKLVPWRCSLKMMECSVRTSSACMRVVIVYCFFAYCSLTTHDIA